MKSNIPRVQIPALQLFHCLAINNLLSLSELSFLLRELGLIIYLGTIRGTKCKVHGIVSGP